MKSINEAHINSRYLPDITLPDNVTATGDLATACRAEAVLLVVPAQHLATTLNDAAKHWVDGVPAVICAKGIATSWASAHHWRYFQGQRLHGKLPPGFLPQLPLPSKTGPSETDLWNCSALPLSGPI